MKKITYSILLLAAMMCMVACTSDDAETPVNFAPRTLSIDLQSAKDSPQETSTRVSSSIQNDMIKSKWQTGDVVYAGGASSYATYVVSGGAGTAKATFSLKSGTLEQAESYSILFKNQYINLASTQNEKGWAMFKNYATYNPELNPGSPASHIGPKEVLYGTIDSYGQCTALYRYNAVIAFKLSLPDGFAGTQFAFSCADDHAVPFPNNFHMDATGAFTVDGYATSCSYDVVDSGAISSGMTLYFPILPTTLNGRYCLSVSDGHGGTCSRTVTLNSFVIASNTEYPVSVTLK